MRLREFRDLKSLVGSRIEFDAMLVSAELREQRNGGKFALLEFVDDDVSVTVTKFNASDEVMSLFESGLVYRLKTEVRAYDKSPSGLSFILEELSLIEGEPSDSYKVIHCGYGLSRGSMNAEFLEMSNSDNPFDRIANALVLRYLERFKTVGAASKMHHAKEGGLLSHTGSMLRVARMLYKHYAEIYGESKINWPLLRAGVLLHDLGKTAEYVLDVRTGASSATPERNAINNHIVFMLTEIGSVGSQLGLSMSEVILPLSHLVASHHGQLEWGSPVQPFLVEAEILHCVDLLDSRVDSALMNGRSYIEVLDRMK